MPEPRSLAAPRVVPVPQWQDNYAYLVINEERASALVVDPADAGPILAEAERRGVRVDAVLNTHHHPDHCNANLDLKNQVGAVVHGSATDAERLPGLDVPLEPGTTVTVDGLSIDVLAVPGHTTGHVGYLIGDDLFTGDTLFIAGCGRLFEGTAAQMYRSLHQVFGHLPDATRIWCGHEYTQKNLEFALTLEPSNAALAARIERARDQRAAGEPTVPSTIGDEKSFNPFLRVDAPELIESVVKKKPDTNGSDPVSVLAAVRALKDAY